MVFPSWLLTKLGLHENTSYDLFLIYGRRMLRSQRMTLFWLTNPFTMRNPGLTRFYTETIRNRLVKHCVLPRTTKFYRIHSLVTDRGQNPRAAAGEAKRQRTDQRSNRDQQRQCWPHRPSQRRPHIRQLHTNRTPQWRTTETRSIQWRWLHNA